MIYTSENINVVLLPMPYKVKGCSCANEDGSYTVIINSKVPQEQHLKIYEHELKHIIGGDFGCDDVEQAELEAHKEGGIR